MQTKRGRWGSVFPLRLTDEERAELEALRDATAGPEGLGPWLVWAARQASRGEVLPTISGNTDRAPGGVLPSGSRIRGVGRLARNREQRLEQGKGNRLVLDLCGRGPYVEARGSAMDRRGAAARAVTPPGFTRAFFEANP